MLSFYHQGFLYLPPVTCSSQKVLWKWWKWSALYTLKPSSLFCVFIVSYMPSVHVEYSHPSKKPKTPNWLKIMTMTNCFYKNFSHLPKPYQSLHWGGADMWMWFITQYDLLWATQMMLLKCDILYMRYPTPLCQMYMVWAG